MSTSAAFYVGIGKKAVGLGHHRYDGYPFWEHQNSGVPRRVITAKDELTFRKEVARYLKAIMKAEDGLSPPEIITWKSAGAKTYVYAFFKGHVWISHVGGHWFNPLAKTSAPRTAPPRPLVNVGKVRISGHIIINCGSCGKIRSVTLDKFQKSGGRNLRLSDAHQYFECRGFRKVSGFGFVCSSCKRYLES